MRRYSNEVILTSFLERGIHAVASGAPIRRERPSARRLRDKLSLADRDAIVRDRQENGDSLSVLARRYGVSDYSIRMILARAGVALGGPRINEDQRGQVMKWHQDGVSNMEIARRTGVTESSVALILAAPVP